MGTAPLSVPASHTPESATDSVTDSDLSAAPAHDASGTQSHPRVGTSSILNRFIPVSATDLARGLIADAERLGLQPDSLAAVIDAIQDAIAREVRSLERSTADAYAPFNPDRDTLPLCHLPREEADTHFSDLERRLSYLFDKANFERLDDFTIESAINEAKTHGLRIRIRADRVDKLLMWTRGRGIIYKRLPHWKSPIRGRNVKCQVFHRLGVLAKLKGDPHVHLKLFRDVPVADIEALLPHAEVGMNWLDRVKVIGGGAGALGTVAVKLLQGALTLALVSKLAWLIAMAVGLMAGRTFLGYRRNKSLRDAQRTRHLYYQTLANNSGVISWLVDTIAQEEEKEAMLGYALGQSASQPLHTKRRIKHAAEAYILDRYGARVDFDEPDAVETLDRFGLWADRALHQTRTPASALTALRTYIGSATPAHYHENCMVRHTTDSNAAARAHTPH